MNHKFNNFMVSAYACSLSTVLMIQKFLKNMHGNYVIMTIAVMIPIMGALALTIHYAEMSRQHEITRSVLNAADIATAQQLQAGKIDTQLKVYKSAFFNTILIRR